MSTCKSQHTKCWIYFFAQIIWVTHSWLNASDLLRIATQRSVHEQWLHPHGTQLHTEDMATAHPVAPGIPATVGSESGVEFNKGLIYCPNKRPWKSAPPPRQFCLEKKDINGKRRIMFLLWNSPWNLSHQELTTAWAGGLLGWLPPEAQELSAMHQFQKSKFKTSGAFLFFQPLQKKS